MNVSAARAAEWLAALTGAADCVLVSVVFAGLDQPMWPLPGLYLIEVAVVGLMVVGLVAARPQLVNTQWNVVPWLASGILLAFVILGGFSIGLYLVPAVIAFLVTGLLIDAQVSGNTPKHFGLLLIPALIQAAVLGSMVTFV